MCVWGGGGGGGVTLSVGFLLIVFRYGSKLRVFSISRFLVKSLIIKKCHNSTPINNNDMKLSPVTKLNKINATMAKKLARIFCEQFITSLSFFRLLADLQQSWIPIPDACFTILIFSLITTFYLTKTENRTERYLTELSAKFRGTWYLRSIFWN